MFKVVYVPFKFSTVKKEVMLCTGVGVGIFLLVVGRVCGVQVTTVDEGFLIRYEGDNQEEFTLPCQYTLDSGESEQTFRLEWLKDGELVYLLTRIARVLEEPVYGDGYSAETVRGPTYGSSSSDRRVDLVLLKPERSDQGRWSCRAEAVLGGTTVLGESFIEHFVYYGPNFLARTMDAISHEGTFGEIVLTCHAEAYPPVQLTWKRVDDDKTLPDGTASYQGDQYGDPGTEKTLTADYGNTTNKYKGEYECVAESLPQDDAYPIGGTASHIVNVLMYDVPVVKAEDDGFVTGPVGWEKLTLKCTAVEEINPTASSITWEYTPDPNRVLEEGVKYDFKTDSKTFMEITIFDIEESDFGRYTCKFKNSVGTGSAVVELQAPDPDGSDGIDHASIDGHIILIIGVVVGTLGLIISISLVIYFLARYPSFKEKTSILKNMLLN